MLIKKFNFVVLSFSTLIFFVLYSLIKQIHFMQNDDWVYYQSIENFLNGNFLLAPLVGITFYTQGFLGLLFTKVTGDIYSLPILTLIISVLNFAIFATILKKQYKVSSTVSILSASLLFLNPLHFYSTLGFMSENFVLFFLLLGIYLINNHQKLPNLKNFLLMNLVLILGFFVKQYLVVAFISLIIFLFFKKLYKYSMYQLAITIVLLFIYYTFFPITNVMQNQSLMFSNLLNFSKMYSLIYVIFVYLCAMMIPLIFVVVKAEFSNLKLKRIASKFLMSIIIVFLATKLFQLFEYPLKDFPYLINTFARKGFYPYGLDGNKYSWIGVYDILRSWNFVSIAILGLFISFSSNFIKKIIKSIGFEDIFFVLYFGLLLITPTLYDRYLLPLIAVGILLLSKRVANKFSGLYIMSLFPFLIFFVGLNYQFSMDYISWQNYVWGRASFISDFESINKSDISSSHAWNNYYNVSENYMYKFSFDSPDKFSQINEMNLVEKKEIDFFGNLFLESNVHLYSRMTDIQND